MTGNCDLCKLQLDTFATAKCGMNEDFAGDFLHIISSVVCCSTLVVVAATAVASAAAVIVVVMLGHWSVY